MDIAKLSRTPFLQGHLETPDSVFMEHICNYNIIKFKVNWPRWLFQPLVETLINIEMPCEILSFLFSDTVKVVTKCG